MSILSGIFGGTYRWDVDRIQDLINKLSTEKSQLEADSQNISTLKGDVETAWQSVAGTSYSGSLDVNEQDIKNIIKRVDNTIQKLTKVRATYSNAESEISGEVRSLSSRIIR
ncbi:MAG: WXG100 family type VII secretion target [Eubacterium sp.]|nr:WXG100 family type VII secretion target [Eubacterium sp.]